MTVTRHLTLDATRGVAVIGILIVNIIAFAMPGDAYIDPTAWGGTAPADLAAWGVVQMLFEGRMRGLFALLFGASAMLVMQRAAAGGGSASGIHRARMLTLALFGAAHFVLVWEGDILFAYALIGLLLPFVRDWSPRRLAITGTAAVLLYTLLWSAMMGALLSLQASAAAPGADAATVAEWRDAMAGMPGTDAALVAEEVALYRGGYDGIVAARLAEAWVPLLGIFLIGGETIGYMLIGMALFKSGLFTGGWPRALIVRRMLIAYAVSLPPIAALTWWAWASGFDPIVLMGNFLGWSLPFRLLSTLGHALLIVLLAQRFARSRLVTRLAAAGRMAFTNYLVTSIVMTTIFYGYGLGLYGHVDRAPVYLFVVALALAMLAWSKPWLDRFAFGPFEWAWRSLARRRFQPWRRNALASQSHLA